MSKCPYWLTDRSMSGCRHLRFCHAAQCSVLAAVCNALSTSYWKRAVYWRTEDSRKGSSPHQVSLVWTRLCSFT